MLGRAALCPHGWLFTVFLDRTRILKISIKNLRDLGMSEKA